MFYEIISFLFIYNFRSDRVFGNVLFPICFQSLVCFNIACTSFI